MTWGLYVRPGGEGVLDWALPESPQQHYIVRNQRAAPVDTAMVNKALQDRLEIALANASPEFSDDLAYFRKKNDDRLKAVNQRTTTADDPSRPNRQSTSYRSAAGLSSHLKTNFLINQRGCSRRVAFANYLLAPSKTRSQTSEISVSLAAA